MIKKTAYYASMVALALIFGFVEFLIPFDFGIPGIKLGLANLVAIFLLYKNGYVPALSVNVVRVLLSGILFGNVMSIFYSLCGGVLSITVMWLVKRVRFLSTVGVSALGGTVHNIGQLLAASVMIGFKALQFYAPFLMLSGVVTGFVIGIAAMLAIKRVKLKSK